MIKIKKTIGIIATIGIICIAITTVHAESKETVIEYGKYLANVEKVVGPYAHTIMQPKTMNLSSIGVSNYIYRKVDNKWQTKAKKTFDVRNTVLRCPHEFYLDDVKNTRSSWVVNTPDGKITGSFALENGKL